MNKSWINIDRRLPEYEKGVEEFLKMAFDGLDNGRLRRCPCRRCKNNLFKSRNVMFEHLITHGMEKDYKQWHHHGEPIQVSTPEDDMDDSESDGMHEMLHDIEHAENINFNEGFEAGESSNASSTGPNEEANKFYKLLEDAEQELYPGCGNFSKLSFVVQVLNIKCLYGLSGRAIDAIFSLLSKAFPAGNKVPSSYLDAKNILKDLGLHYENIDACVNDCILYRDKYVSALSCPVCGASRWKNTQKQVQGKRIPQKILRYFPLTPRLQRLYVSPKIAEEMRWHKEKLPNDQYMRHPADSLAWKDFDNKHPAFAADCRNVRLGLATDGFNPFGNMSTCYSVWPVVMVVYNLPPWMCMKSSYFFMSLLIPGPKAPGNDIDVYLQPLIDELKYLWEHGVETYDAALKCTFQLHAAVLWGIHDFPTYAVLSGWSTKGYLACPCCNMDTCSLRLPNGKKNCYMGHRRFLPLDHPWRNDAKSFDGEVEHRMQPKQLSGSDVVEKLKAFNPVTFGKKTKRKRGEDNLPGNWKKKSIFFELPYWSTLMIRHNLDIMHIEKNVCDSLLGTLLNIQGKTKDTLSARFDLQYMGIRPELHATQVSDEKYSFHQACYTIPVNKRKTFCSFLANIKVPDGYSSNISRYVKVDECKIFGMKCHDCHIFLHRYLPLAIRGVLRNDVCEALIELSTYFRKLCAKKVNREDLEALEKSIPLTLCKLEKLFPPSFFDIMMHLPVHLATEAKIAGPVQYRWMFSVESYLRILKSFVRNKARPEGSIAEAYIVQESVTFCSRYLHGVETHLNQVGRNYEGVNDVPATRFQIFSQAGKQLRGKKYGELSMVEWEQARNYILKNCGDIADYIKLHKEKLQKERICNIEDRHEKEFFQWFKSQVFQLKEERNEAVDDELLALACGPDRRVWHYTSYLVNGWRFRIKEQDLNLKTQNSGVLVKGDESTGTIDYFGTLTDIIKVEYPCGYSVVLFKCDWWDVCHKGRGYKEDKYGFILLNTTRQLNTNEPYVLATQAEQVYYVKDIEDPNWQVVVKTKPRDLYDIPYEEAETETDPCQENEEIGGTFSEHVENVEVGALLNSSELVSVAVQAPPIAQNSASEDICETDEEDELLFYDSSDDDPGDNVTEDDLDDDL